MQKIMRNLPIDALRTYVAVVQLGGFTPAGELLGRSQPAISLQIKRLEELLDQPLLVRSRQHIELTAAGGKLLDYAQRILALNDEALSQFDGTGVSGKVRFGIPSEFASSLLPKIVSRFIRTYPNITLEVHSDLSITMRSPSQRRNYDLILAVDDNPRKTKRPQVKSESLVWVTSPDHDVHLHNPLPLIVAPEPCIYRNRALQALKKAGRSWRIVYTIPDLNGIHAAIEEGLGITVLAKSTVPENLKTLYTSKRLPALGKVGISFIFPEENHSQAVDVLAGYLKASLT